MKISNSKKELARIIRENGGWRDVAEWAAQDSKIDQFPFRVCFYQNRPTIEKGDTRWIDGNCRPTVDSVDASSQIENWHQTILSRDEYFHLYPAPDADGWIEWKGGECPVEQGALVDIKDADGVEWLAVKAAPQDEYSDASNVFWGWNCTECNRIVAYRLHNPENNNLTQVDDIDVVESKPTIEQLAADYRNAKDCAERKQQEADAAKADADAKLAELVAAGKAIGLVLSVAGGDPELVITDWRDLQVGDEVEASYRGIERVVGTVLKIDVGDNNQPIFVSDGVRSIWATEFRFISRP